MATVPTPVFGQAAIAGSVIDSSGAPLTSVIVEASSPVLIERIRTTVTDATGRYRIEELRPGAYEVTFSLAGWNPYQRRVELTGSFTATVDATLGVADLTTLVTVTGQFPTVDVHSARREITLGGDLVKSIPTVRSYNALVVLIPGVVTAANDTVTGTATTSFPMHGGRVE